MVPDETCKTAWVDGRALGYNPAWVETMTHDQLKGLVAHEVNHCAMGHPWRRQGRGMKRWNVATDKAINGILRECGFSLPSDGHFPTDEEKGKSAEWIHARLGDGDEEGQGGNGAGQGQGDGDGQGKPDPLGEVRDAPNEPDADGSPAPTEQEWKERTSGAAQYAKMQGKLPANMERLVQQALRARVDVRSLLLRFFSERATGDYSWTRPNVRYLAQGLYLPSLESHDLGEVAIMVDTSGSMDETSLGYARGIVEGVIDECAPSRVSVYYADAQVCNVEHFEKGEPLTWKPAGGGGTDFRPALEAIERDETPVCVVCITDLYGTFPSVAPNIPVLWLSSTEGLSAPFGETVFIDR